MSALDEPKAGLTATAQVCARLQGHSVVVCRCKTSDGFLACPDHALRVLTPTYPPAAYRQQPASISQLPTDGMLDSYQQPVAAPAPRARPAYSGYTGSICDACGGLRMRRAGTCEVCDDCGHAGGCG